jgi:hypothetical protein
MERDLFHTSGKAAMLLSGQHGLLSTRLSGGDPLNNLWFIRTLIAPKLLEHSVMGAYGPQ